MATHSALDRESFGSSPNLRAKNKLLEVNNGFNRGIYSIQRIIRGSKYQIESLEDPIKDISDDEQRGYLKALFDQLNQAKEELYQSSINLLNEIDKNI